MLDISQAAAENTQTFVHEYVHFLQDLFLPYCIRENLVRIATFFDFMDRARHLGEIRLPNSASLEGAELTSLQTSVTWGDSQFISSVGRIENIKITEVPVDKHKFILYQYDLLLDDGTVYQLGARDLLEYIAWKIESKHFAVDQQLPDLPYNSVDLLSGYFDLSELNHFKRVALAEYCLQNDNPAHRLMMFLKDLKTGSIDADATKSDEAFVTYLKSANWMARGVIFEPVSDKIARRCNELRQSLQAKFPQGAFPSIYSWLDRVIDYAHANLAGRSFFAELWNLNSEEFFGKISQILRDVGIPLIVNDTGELGTSLGDGVDRDQFIQLLLAYEFMDYLGHEDMQCPLLDVCERDKPELIDNDCMDAPFRRALKDHLCPFGAFAKTHGLDQLRWHVKDRLVSRESSRWP
ncbi:hypothetical protein [Stenotrophomonas maltophilia]|uniref:Uncharacterized protein n=1 Tax=Stenotrophomonas maltophilia TaxID=40324 RepID=A0AAJ2JE18_STEMA|nr:hypothetical protein [Stenotrophomonas maltophilia]MDT3469866.1 hypothetical protein [Stenotrophomonas maltophilia]